MAALEGRSYSPILEEPYRWSRWAAPKNASGQLDHHAALSGDDLRDFVNVRLFPYLERFKQSASGPNTIEYKIGEIFGELRNKISSGYNLREIIDGLDGLRLRSQAEKHELSMLYEEKIKRMGNAGRNGGEYYTPRPLIRAIVQLVNPFIGETVYDPAVGSAGFLCEAFEFMRKGGSTGGGTQHRRSGHAAEPTHQAAKPDLYSACAENALPVSSISLRAMPAFFAASFHPSMALTTSSMICPPRSSSSP